MSSEEQLINHVIANTLGVDEEEISPEADFRLDLNATAEELEEVRVKLEEMLEISLPVFNDELPATVEELYMLVEDSSL